MQIEKEKFIFCHLNLMLAIREGKRKHNLDDIIGRLENIQKVLDEVHFVNQVEEEIFGKKEE